MVAQRSPKPLVGVQIPARMPIKGSMLQGVAADCKSAEEAHEWFDSITPHHFTEYSTAWQCAAFGVKARFYIAVINTV